MPGLSRRVMAMVAVLGVGLLVVIEGAPALAADAVALRARFAAGQSYGYRVRVSMQMNAETNLKGAARPTQELAALALDGSVRVYVVRVDTRGVADARISRDQTTLTTTTAGKTVSKALPADAAQEIRLGPDGSLNGSVNGDVGGYAMQSTALLPSAPVAPGARWTGATMVNVLGALGISGAPLQVSGQFVFARVVSLRHEKAAVIDSSGTLQYITDMRYQDMPVHIHITAALAGQSMFGLSSHRTVASQAHLDMRVYISGRDSKGAAFETGEHVVISSAIQ